MTSLTLQRIEEDIARLNEAEAAYEAERAASYDFTPAPQQESQSTMKPIQSWPRLIGN
jgi:hypothetical protein